MLFSFYRLELNNDQSLPLLKFIVGIKLNYLFLVPKFNAYFPKIILLFTNAEKFSKPFHPLQNHQISR